MNLFFHRWFMRVGASNTFRRVVLSIEIILIAKYWRRSWNLMLNRIYLLILFGIRIIIIDAGLFELRFFLNIRLRRILLFFVFIGIRFMTCGSFLIPIHYSTNAWILNWLVIGIIAIVPILMRVCMITPLFSKYFLAGDILTVWFGTAECIFLFAVGCSITVTRTGLTHGY